MISAIYASILALLISWLSLNVIKARRRNRVRYGDGGIEELQMARAAQSNATNYIPIALLLLFALEYGKANMWIIHILGVALVVGRFIHARGILSENMKGRVLGMKITIFTIIALAITNIVSIPYGQLFKI